MTPEWASVIGSTVAAVAAILVAYLAHGARSAAKKSAGHAETAADNSKPVSNGFTKEVRDGLADILTIATEARNEATLARELGEANQAAHLRHMEAHANGAAYDMRRIV